MLVSLALPLFYPVVPNYHRRTLLPVDRPVTGLHRPSTPPVLACLSPSSNPSIGPALSSSNTVIPIPDPNITSNPKLNSDIPTVPKKRKNGRSHDKRAKERRIRKEENPGPSPSTYAKVLSHGTAIEVEVDAVQLPAAKGAVTGKKGTVDELGDAISRERFYTAVELVNKHGFQHIPWDGK